MTRRPVRSKEERERPDAAPAKVESSKDREAAREKRRELRRVVAGALVVFEDRPEVLRKVLEKVASLADDVVDVLRRADERSTALKVRAGAVAVRGFAMLPSFARLAILRKLASKI